MIRVLRKITCSSDMPIHPAMLRCSSLTYSRYARSSRLAWRATQHTSKQVILRRTLRDRETIKELNGCERRIKVTGLVPAQRLKGLKKGIPAGIKKVIAVHSGKGGVGKTFVAINLAVKLAKDGCRVGLLDADVDCPNVVKVLKLHGKLIANSNKKIVPLEKYGVKIVSMAPIQQDETMALMWRGPIVSKVVEQFVHDTDWGNLDFLIVDLPPGTSDIPISILKILEGCSVLVVTTPQETAIIDAKKSINLAKKMGAKILGVIENMSGKIFGGGKNGAGHKMANELNIPFLGSIKLEAAYLKMLENAEIPSLIDKELERILDFCSNA